MLKTINKNSNHQTNLSKTEKQQTKTNKIGASNKPHSSALVIVREQPVFPNKEVNKTLIDKEFSPKSEIVKKEATKTQFEGVLETPFYKLLDTQREVSPVKSHRLCGRVPFTGKRVGEAEKNHYTFSTTEHGNLKKDGIFYCGSGFCLWCEAKRRLDNQDEFRMVLENCSPEKVFITFTAKPKKNLKNHIEKMKDAFGRVVESLKRECVKRYGEEPIYVKVCETTANPYRDGGTTHFHLHALFSFADNKTGEEGVLTMRNLKWMETFLVDKWAKFGTKVGLIVRKSAQEAKVVGAGSEDIAKLSIYLTKGLAMELASSGLKDSKTNYSLKSVVALVSQGCEQAKRLYGKMASSLFGTNLITRSKGWRELYRELLEQQEKEASEQVQEEQEEEAKVRELIVGRLTYKGCVSQFGAWIDELILNSIKGGYGENAFTDLEQFLSIEWEKEMLEEAESELWREIAQDKCGIDVDEEKRRIQDNFENNLKELVAEWMVKHRVEAHSIKGRTFSFRTKDFVMDKVDR